MNDIATAATLACLWEVTAPKPGNVYRGADFEDVTYADFLASAAVIGPPLAAAAELGVGRAVLDCVHATRAAVGTNTNLGTILLLAPLAAVNNQAPLREGIATVLARLNTEDTRQVYEAIRLARPGGLGKVDQADVGQPPPNISLVEAMRPAAERDLIARQYTNNFAQVFWVADQLAAYGSPLSIAIVRTFLELLAEFPDSLVVRKCGKVVSEEVSRRAARVLSSSSAESEEFESAMADFDFWLRADGHRRNPGTSADLIAAGLFVLLRENRLPRPIRFY